MEFKAINVDLLRFLDFYFFFGTFHHLKRCEINWDIIKQELTPSLFAMSTNKVRQTYIHNTEKL